MRKPLLLFHPTRFIYQVMCGLIVLFEPPAFTISIFHTGVGVARQLLSYFTSTSDVYADIDTWPVSYCPVPVPAAIEPVPCELAKNVPIYCYWYRVFECILYSCNAEKRSPVKSHQRENKRHFSSRHRLVP